MLASLRSKIAGGLEILAQRLSSEPPYTEQSRVPYTPRTLAGVPITPDTAVTNAAVWACLRYLSQTVAVLPWHVMRDGDSGAEVQSRHSVDYLIYKRPNPEWSSFQFRETLIHWALRYGNGYAEIERDSLGRPVALWPIPPWRVEVCRDDTGVLYYEVNNGTLPSVDLDALNMFHVRGFGEGPVGVNVIHYAAQSLGWAKAAQLFGAAFFGNGATPKVHVRNKKALTPDGLKLQKAEFAQLFKGPRGAHNTAHTDSDTEIQMLSFNAEQTQLIEVHQFLVEEICRWFGVPPHKVMHLLRATFSNIEHQAIEVVVDSVNPWIRRFEDEADYKLFGQNRSGLYTKMNIKALLRGDYKAQAEFLRAVFDMGAYSPNDILKFLDENTIGPDGDKRFVQLNLTTLGKAGVQPVQPQPKKAAAPPADELDAMDGIRALKSQIENVVPFKPRAKKVSVTKHDENGRILEFVQEEI